MTAATSDLTLASVGAMFRDVRKHYRESGEVDEGQVCRNMMVTRVRDFAQRINNVRVGPSGIHGDGLFASRDIEAGDLITFFPGDALLVWEDGNREGDFMIFFGAHIPQSERDAKEISQHRVKQYELYSSAEISAVGDPARRDEPAYLGHLANDGSTCASPTDKETYRRDSTRAANAEPVLIESCHFALVATRSIQTDEEILFCYGEGYWLARAGHGGVGTNIKRLGASAPDLAGANDNKLSRALKQSRPRKGAKARQPSKAKLRKQQAAAKNVKPAAKGFA